MKDTDIKTLIEKLAELGGGKLPRQAASACRQMGFHNMANNLDQMGQVINRLIAAIR